MAQPCDQLGLPQDLDGALGVVEQVGYLLDRDLAVGVSIFSGAAATTRTRTHTPQLPRRNTPWTALYVYETTALQRWTWCVFRGA